MHQKLPLLVLTVAAGASSLLAQGDFNKAVSYYKQGQFARAATEFEAIVKEQPDYEAGHRVLGDCYLKLKDYGKASAAFKRAVELDANNYVNQYGLGVASYNQGRYREAATALLRAEKLAPGPKQRYEVLSLRGSAYYNLRDYARAAADLERAVQAQRGQFKDVLQLGVSYYKLDKQAEAERFLTQAAALDPSSGEAAAFLADLQYQQALSAIDAKQYSTAIQKLEAFVARKEDDSDAWFNLGLAYLFSKQLPKAEAAFVRSSELNGARWQTWDRLGYVYEVLGRYGKSLESYGRALALNKTDELQESVDRIRERIRRGN